MIFFINPISSLVQNLSQDKALLRAYLGLSGAMAQKPITNSVGEFSFYYNRFLGYLIYHLENTIAEIEAADTYVQEQASAEMESVQKSALANNTVDDLETAAPEAKADIFSESPNLQPAPHHETPTDSTSEKNFDEIKLQSLKQRMLSCKCKRDLEAFKSEIGSEKASELWESCSIPERNYIKCIGKAQATGKSPALLGHSFCYTNPKTKKQHEALYLGYYLHGDAIADDNQRAIVTQGMAIICDKKDLKPIKNRLKRLTDSERKGLEAILSTPPTVCPPENDSIFGAGAG